MRDPTSAMARDHSFLFIQTLRRKKIIRWLNVGRRMLRESCFLLVFSPSSSEYWSPCRSRTSDHVHRIPRRFISRTSINFSPTQMYMTHSPLPRCHTTCLLSAKIRRLGELTVVLSLAISLTSALLATLLHQWTRRYVTVTQPIQSSPHKRARIRAFLPTGLTNCIYPGLLKRYPLCCIFLSPYSLPASSYSCSMSTRLPSMP
ncbi:hypothetical protein BJV77DRAFT_774287 [Russula vinacea]|nr:hypothetical protein BJV77DRAFT_774287 [Russula vinacea]